MSRISFHAFTCLLIVIPEQSPKVAEVRLTLAREEEAQQANGIVPPHVVPASAWLQTGLDLEEMQ